MQKFTHLKALFGVCLTVAASAAFANLKPTDNSQQHIDEEVEVLTINGRKPIGYFREQMYLAEESFYDLYNTMTTDESYKITCGKRRNNSSQVRSYRCEPNYVSEIKEKMIDEAFEMGSSRNKGLISIGRKASDSAIRLAINKKREKQIKDVSEHVEKSPELQQKLIALLSARNAYDNKRINTFGEKWVHKASHPFVGK